MNKYYSNRQTCFLSEPFILTLFFALKPLYLFKSGGMQVCDFIIIICFFIILIRDNLRIRVFYRRNKWFAQLSIYTVYVVSVNLIWFILLALQNREYHKDLILSCLYYAYNLAVVYMCFKISSDVGFDSTISALTKGCTISCLVNLLGVILHYGHGLRNTGFFNNPNQLGFYSIIILSFLAFFGANFSNKEKLLVLFTGIYGSVISLSKASIVSMFALGLLHVLGNRKKRHQKKMQMRMLLIVILLLLVYVFLYSDLQVFRNNYILNEVRERILYMWAENDSNFGSGRGYSRVTELGLNYLWGMGEGAYTRFAVLQGLEVHSTYVTILVSYGILGVILALPCFIKPLVKHYYTISNICNISGIALYSLTHNGIRNSLVWVLMSTLIISNMGTGSNLSSVNDGITSHCRTAKEKKSYC